MIDADTNNKQKGGGNPSRAWKECAKKKKKKKKNARKEGKKGWRECCGKQRRREDCVLRGAFRPELESGDLTANCTYLPSNALTFSNPCFRRFFM
jgi:hypothetical protein